jgi:hypothetical protein
VGATTQQARRDAVRAAHPRSEANAAFLRRAVPFEPCLGLEQPELRALAEQLLGELVEGRTIYRRDRWIEALAAVLANVLEACRTRPRRPVRISRDHRSSPRRYGGLSHVIEVIDLLQRRGYIGMKMGYHYDDGDSAQTRIWALPELLRTHRELLCAAVTMRPPHEPVELYAWREHKSDERKLIDYDDTAFTHRVRKVLRTANEVNGRARIEYSDGFEQQRILSYVKAIFYESFALYGRIHSYGCRHAQGLSESERETITINGDHVVERDFSALHPRLLYAAAGIEYLGDPYTVVVEKLLAPSGDARGTLRSFLKLSLLALVSARDFRHAEQAANNWLHENHAERRDLRALGITRARPVLEAFMEAHAPIAHNFCGGKRTGLRTMNKDARICLDIVWHFVRRRVPIIPVHDSFLVAAQHADELERVMKATYRKHSGGFSCPIR